MMNLLNKELKIFPNAQFVIGCDEVGRGSLAGPVTVGAVMFECINSYPKNIHFISDSKALSAQKRNALFDIIQNHALATSLVDIGPKIIDSINIHNAVLKGMEEAIYDLLSYIPKNSWTSTLVLIDGKFIPYSFNSHKNLKVISKPKADGLFKSVGAASIMAKVHRDRLLEEHHQKYPNYNFFKNKGYGTPEHLAAIRLLGLTNFHRQTFCDHIA